MKKIGLVWNVVLSVLARVANKHSKTQKGWGVVVYEKGEVREE